MQGLQTRVAPTFQAILRRCFGFPGSLLSSIGRTRRDNELAVCVHFGIGLQRFGKFLSFTQPVLERVVCRAGIGSDRREVNLYRCRSATGRNDTTDGKHAGLLTFTPVA